MGWNNTSEILSHVAAGNVHGATAFNLYGVNPANTTAYDTVWGNSNAYTFVTSAIGSPTIVSSNAADDGDPVGTGARTVRITGVNASYAVVTEDVTLNGTGAVNLTGSYITINDITVLTVGSGGVPAGNLTLAGTGPVTHGYVLAGQNKSTSAIYCVPANYSLLIYKIGVQFGTNSTGANQFKLAYSTNGGPVYNVGPLYKEPYTETPTPFEVPLHLPEKTQFRVDALSASAVTCSVHVNGVLLNRTNTTAAQAFAKWI